MTLYKTIDLNTFVQKLRFLEPFEQLGVIWQTFYNGEYYSILIHE